MSVGVGDGRIVMLVRDARRSEWRFGGGALCGTCVSCAGGEGGLRVGQRRSKKQRRSKLRNKEVFAQEQDRMFSAD